MKVILAIMCTANNTRGAAGRPVIPRARTILDSPQFLFYFVSSILICKKTDELPKYSMDLTIYLDLHLFET